METKRKASSSTSSSPAGGNDDRAAKKRRLHLIYNLELHESPESTYEFGLNFLDQIRNTKDKSGRLVAGHFEDRLPYEGNEDYYSRIKMPLCLKDIDEKLRTRQYPNLTALESDVKRMVCNAKEWYHRTSLTYEDAERVRKAMSNYMTTTNPAYKNILGYTATPTPFTSAPMPFTPSAVAPPPPFTHSAVATQTGFPALAAQPHPHANYGPPSHSHPLSHNISHPVPIAPAIYSAPNTPAVHQHTELIQPVHPINMPVSTRGGYYGEGDVDDTPKKRGPGRPPKDSPIMKGSPPISMKDFRNDNQYLDVPYKGLSFQQAQEKVVEEVIRKRDEDNKYAHFQEFMNLPARALKDYYSFTKKPMSIKKLQKAVYGFRGKAQHPTGTTDFPTWAAFEETAKLLWDNAFDYNEDDSEIYALAEELQDFFMDHLNQARAAVNGPSTHPAKIKLKVPAAIEATALSSVASESSSIASPRKITLQVRGHGAPATSPSVNGSTTNSTTNGGPGRSPGRSQLPNLVANKSPSVSASVVSASPSVVHAMPSTASRDDVARNSSELTGGPSHPLTNGIIATARVQQPVEEHTRPTGHTVANSMLPSVQVCTPNARQSDPAGSPTTTSSASLVNLEILPDPVKLQQSVTVNVPQSESRLQIIPTLSPMVQSQQLHFKLYVRFNGGRSMQPTGVDPKGVNMYEVQLIPGRVNDIMVALVVAIPESQRQPGGPEAVAEKVSVFASMIRS